MLVLVKKCLKLILKGHLILIAFVALLLILMRFFNPPFHSLMLYRNVGKMSHLPTLKPIPLAKLPKSIPEKVVFLEDGTFYQHYGFNRQAIQAAYRRNQRGTSRYLYGGSTITQQLARTLFLVPNRNYLRKYLELIIAIEMECILPKERILELYLNVIEWGPGVYGIEAGSQYHFNKSVHRLSETEINQLLTLIASPVINSPKTLNNNGILRSRYNRLKKSF